MFKLLILSLAALPWILPARADGAPLPLGELAKPGRVLMLRHAHAPGFGDPPNFVIGDCSTQRNLDEETSLMQSSITHRICLAVLVLAPIPSPTLVGQGESVPIRTGRGEI